jgi:uncharacterized protein YbjT (DUF2867 family)
MTSPILITGGTGTLGQYVVARLTGAGRDVRVLSRRAHDPVPGVEFVRGDLTTGDGIDAAVAGAATIVHCASGRTGDAEATGNLVRAASAGTHLVYISIVGVDRFSLGYYRTKLASEQVVIDSGLPWTILRATQFYDLIWSGARVLGRLPVVPVPAGFPTRPIHADDVAARLVELALGSPAGMVDELGGPEVRGFADLIREYLRINGKRRWVVPVWIPGLGRVRAGALLPTTQPVEGPTRTWAEFVADKAAES